MTLLYIFQSHTLPGQFASPRPVAITTRILNSMREPVTSSILASHAGSSSASIHKWSILMYGLSMWPAKTEHDNTFTF